MNIETTIPAWQKAAEDLHIKVRAPFVVVTADHDKICFPLLIESFGRNTGTLLFSLIDIEGFKAGSKFSYYCSAVNVSSYSKYDRQFFIDTLNDWGYFGEAGQKPEWYTGKPWT